MSHGLPNGFVRLYDEQGNPVAVGRTSAGEYTLLVQDDRTRRLLEDILAELRKLNVKE